MKYIMILLIGAGLNASCTKTYNCECRNTFQTYSAGPVTGTKKKAKESCQKLSTTETTCYIK